MSFFNVALSNPCYLIHVKSRRAQPENLYGMQLQQQDDAASSNERRAAAENGACDRVHQDRS